MEGICNTCTFQQPDDGWVPLRCLGTAEVKQHHGPIQRNPKHLIKDRPVAFAFTKDVTHLSIELGEAKPGNDSSNRDGDQHRDKKSRATKSESCPEIVCSSHRQARIQPPGQFFNQSSNRSCCCHWYEVNNKKDRPRERSVLVGVRIGTYTNNQSKPNRLVRSALNRFSAVRRQSEGCARGHKPPPLHHGVLICSDAGCAQYHQEPAVIL